MLFRNYKARHIWAEERLYSRAASLRHYALGVLESNFDVAEFIESALPRFFGGRKTHVVAMIEECGAPAYADLVNLSVHVDSDILRDARLGDAESRFALAHECAHLVLHEGDAHFFSQQGEFAVKGAEPWQTTEWQADRYAVGLLVTEDEVKSLREIERIVEVCQVPEWVAVERHEAVFSSRCLPPGALCRKCGDFLSSMSSTSGACSSCERQSR
ncbi:ImmA/IrrE family metallo-endopeptidase [Salinarimonas ramus]|uniref:ImmA/IrrE family metallo-endopeptidase n=1 Tax=Salinarimonas ramus TaxID=690164 RepID=UPI00166ADE9E|nr:ImmA/IrrE family metallo-endopeptidase [Salinarimonas ramus]